MSDLDELMDRDPEELSARDLDDIIAYHRKKRADRAAPGAKRGAKKDIGDAPKIDLSKIVQNIATIKSAPPSIVKRRI